MENPYIRNRSAGYDPRIMKIYPINSSPTFKVISGPNSVLIDCLLFCSSVCNRFSQILMNVPSISMPAIATKCVRTKSAVFGATAKLASHSIRSLTRVWVSSYTRKIRVFYRQTDVTFTWLSVERLLNGFHMNKSIIPVLASTAICWPFSQHTDFSIVRTCIASVCLSILDKSLQNRVHSEVLLCIF